MIDKQELEVFIQERISEFHQKRMDSLLKIKLKDILKRKNPYLYRAKNLLTASDIIKAIFEAHLSSQEEGIFGNIIEQVAIYVARNVYGGSKSCTNGIDLEIINNNIRYLVAIKSGPNWGNKSQIDKMKLDFITAKRTLATSGNNEIVVCINGCCYGKDSKPDKGDYKKLCGQSFWAFISNENDFYIDIIEPLGHQAKEKNDEFNIECGKIINKLTKDFLIDFCKDDGSIDWTAVLKFNSAASDASVF